MLKSLQKQKSDLESLQEKVEHQKIECKNQFTKLNGSIVYKHGFNKTKPFEITLSQIKQLAQTPVGYSLHMLDTFDLTKEQHEQQKHIVQQRIDMEQSLMESAMHMKNSSMGPSTGFGMNMMS